MNRETTFLLHTPKGSPAFVRALAIGGRVLSWEPHSRLVLSWEITADFQHDPNLKTEVEVRFIPEGKDGTRVELEHRHLERYGARHDEIRAIFDSDGGWKALLDAFATRASAE